MARSHRILTSGASLPHSTPLWLAPALKPLDQLAAPALKPFSLSCTFNTSAFKGGLEKSATRPQDPCQLQISAFDTNVSLPFFNAAPTPLGL
jgi:hypothetical protein